MPTKTILTAAGAFAASFVIAFSILSFLDWKSSIGQKIEFLESARAADRIHVLQNDLDDFAKTEGDNGKVIAA